MTSEAGIVGGAAVPHAPQFFTLPPTEDAEQVARVEERMARIGSALRALEPDVVVIVANDHLENFLLHCVPSFTVHRGPHVVGSFAGRDFRWPVASEAATQVVVELQDQGFDPAVTVSAGIGYEFGIPLTFCGFDRDTPLIPVYVNSYVPPQPSGDRCYAFGRALHRALRAAGLRAVIIASGGLSHYPGTDLYSNPDLSTDEVLVDQIGRGNLRSLLQFDDAALDRTGNVEARSWLILAGAIGERVPDEVALEPSWHHNYAIAGWYSPAKPDATTELHYPLLRPDQLTLNEALFRLRIDPGACASYLQDPSGFAGNYDLAADEAAALTALDETALRGLGVHPLLAFLARLHVDLVRRGRTEVPPARTNSPAP
jgi:2,3-dihydroxyphenylpropionate 1,2-dioxygenase